MILVGEARSLRLRNEKLEPLSLFPARSVWTLALNNQLTGPPAYDAERAYFAIEGDRLVAYSLEDGVQQWLVPAQVRTQSAVGDNLIFSAEPESIVARRAADGVVAWELPLPGTLATAPVWDNGWLIAPTTTGTVFAFRGADGHLIWSVEIGSPAHALPALAADRVYVPTDDGRVVALQVETGATLWERRLGAAAGDILAVDERVYVGSKDNFLYCLLAKNGSVDWRWRTGGDVIGLPAVDEHNVYFVALDNVLRALNRTSGGQQWMKPLPIRPAWGPVKAATTIIISGLATALQAYNLKDGSSAGELSPGGEVATVPHVISEPGVAVPRLVVVSRDIAKGATVTLVTRRFDPETTTIAPLPNAVSVTPQRQP